MREAPNLKRMVGGILTINRLGWIILFLLPIILFLYSQNLRLLFFLPYLLFFFSYLFIPIILEQNNNAFGHYMVSSLQVHIP